jgi:oligopeptide transport system ATP-binding protein
MNAPATPLLSVRDLRVHFPVRDTTGAVVKAVDGISFDIAAGQTVALVGESGCGKSTTAYAIIGFEPVTSGSVFFKGRDVTHLDKRARRALAGDMQIVFQDPSAALNPKMSISDSIAEPLVIEGRARADRERRVTELLDMGCLKPTGSACRTLSRAGSDSASSSRGRLRYRPACWFSTNLSLRWTSPSGRRS